MRFRQWQIPAATFLGSVLFTSALVYVWIAFEERTALQEESLTSPVGRADESQSSRSIPAPDEHDFRDVDWGMSPAEVKSRERAKFMAEKGRFLIYEGRVADLDCQIGYIFAGDKLVRANYRFVENHLSPRRYFVDYEKLQFLLHEKYGEWLVGSNVEWKDETFKDQGEQSGLALSLGHVELRTDWETPSAYVILNMRGENSRVETSIVYISEEFSHLDEAARLMDELADLAEALDDL